MNILYAFEEIVKKYKALFFDKVKEKSDTGWKVIYNIQGLNYKNSFYPNLKFIFWMNKDRSELSDNVVTYLYAQNCEFKSQMIQEDNFENQVDSILSEIKSERSNDDIINFILNGTDKFNSEAKAQKLELFFDNLAYKPSGNSACLLHVFEFDLSANDILYTFELKCNEHNWRLIFDNQAVETSIEDVYKKIIEIINETNRINVQ